MQPMEPNTAGSTNQAFDKQVATGSPIGDKTLGDRDRQQIEQRFAFVDNPNLPRAVHGKIVELQTKSKTLATQYFAAIPEGPARVQVLDCLTQAWALGKNALESSYVSSVRS